MTVPVHKGVCWITFSIVGRVSGRRSHSPEISGYGSFKRACMQARKELEMDTGLYPPSKANTTRPLANSINCKEIQGAT